MSIWLYVLYGLAGLLGAVALGVPLAFALGYLFDRLRGYAW